VTAYLLDEDVPPAVAPELRRRGIDAISVHEVGRAGHGIPDAEQLGFAIGQQRAIVTYNRRDFQHLDRDCREAGIRHHGIIWGLDAMVAQWDVGGIIRAIQAIDQTYDDLSGLVIPLARAD
jgi:hypothetical protein